MVFTEEDAANDGLIKREAGREMAKVAKTNNPEWFDHFQNVCDEMGRAPADVLGEMAVRALNNEGYADRIFNTEVSMRKIRQNDISLEDVKYVKTLADEFDIGQSQQSSDPIENLINQRLESVTGSPLSNLTNKDNGGGGNNGQVMQYMERLDKRLDRMEEEIEGSSAEAPEGGKAGSGGGQSIDDLFGGDDSSGREGEGSDPLEPENPVEGTGSEDEQTGGMGDPTGETTGMTESPDEPFGGQAGESDEPNPFEEEAQEVEIENRGHDVSEEEEVDKFSSEGATEE